MSVQVIYQNYLQELTLSQKLELAQMLINQTLTGMEKPKKQKAQKLNVMNFAKKGQNQGLKIDAQKHIQNLRNEWD